ncbi:hypothetical protein [Tenacibaculum maritimum]|uniref:hypothetical protein n=1 Tax=Tenacibaculum maritimum TaxID=107401 RepID=UPI0012E58AC3|nr:hypothetical protein [Tenacibaculum maritimum]CAA0223835.1 hypothetical protein. probable transmembrane protein [Tenacibaculum maritimum]
MNNMSESRKNFTENINRNKLKDHVLSFKEAKDQFYDPKVHTDWEEKVIFISEDKPAKWCVFRIYIDEEDYSIYTFSDGNGNIALPNEEAKELDIDIIYSSDESTFNEIFGEVKEQQSQKTKWKYEVGGLILALLIGYISFILPGQIRQYKLQKEQELISNVIAKPYADYENYRSQIVNRVDSLEEENPFIYVYTNDTEPLDFCILPNLQVYQNNNSYSPDFSIKQMQADDLKWFIDNEDTKGYDIWLNTNRVEIVIGRLNKNKGTDLNVSMTYFYSKKTKEHLKKQAKKRNERRLLNYTRRENLDSIQTARVIVPTKIEEKPKNNLGNMLMRFDEKIIQSAIKQKNPTQKIYLSFYSKNATKEELESKIEEFEKLFYDGKKSKDYKIRKVYLKK